MSFRECRSGVDINHSWLLWQPIGIAVSTCKEGTSVDMIYLGISLNVSLEVSAFISKFCGGVSLGKSLFYFVQLPIYLQQQTKKTVAA